MASVEAVIDLDAVRTSTAELVRRAGSAAVMAVVKADGYGHGMLPCARAALQAGAQWLGAAKPAEALELRAAGIDAPILSGSPGPATTWRPRRGRDRPVRRRARGWFASCKPPRGRPAGPRASISNVDTGLHRERRHRPPTGPSCIDAALKAAADGTLEIVGIWSHFALADDPGHPTVRAQLTHYREALRSPNGPGSSPADTASGQLGRHPRDPRRALRSGPPRHLDLRAFARARWSASGRGLGPAAGDDAARRNRFDQTGSCRQRRLLRPPLPHRARGDAGSGPARLRRRRAPPRHATSPRC